MSCSCDRENPELRQAKQFGNLMDWMFSAGRGVPMPLPDYDEIEKESDEAGKILCPDPVEMTDAPLGKHVIGARPNECFTCLRARESVR